MSCRTRMEGPELEVAPCVYECVSEGLSAHSRPLDRTPSHFAFVLGRRASRLQGVKERANGRTLRRLDHPAG